MDSYYNLDDDNDSQLSDDMTYDLEPDDEVPSLDKTVGDDFLHKVSCICRDTNDECTLSIMTNENQKWNKMVPILGMRFSNPMELKNCVTNYAVKNGCNLYYEKNDSNNLLSLIDEHNCLRVFNLASIVTYKWIGNHFKNQILQNPKTSVRKIKAKVSTRFNLTVSVGHCRNSNRFTLEEVKGSVVGNYGKVQSYIEEIMRTNPMVKIDVDGVKDGWIASCSRVVVAIENKETCKWFLDLLMDGIEMIFGYGLNLISNQYKGLLEVVKKRFQQQSKDNIKKIEPLAYEHLMEMDTKSWSRAFFEVVRAFDSYVNDILESFNSVIDAARKTPLITMFEEIQIYAMDRMYKQLVKGLIWGNLNICPSIRLQILKLKRHQRLVIYKYANNKTCYLMDIFWGVVPSCIQQYEVRIENEGYVMDLNNRTCRCRSWQLAAIPCMHEVEAISYLDRNVEDYVAPWFTTTMFLSCYNHTINLINGSSIWPERGSKGKTKHTILKLGMVMRCTICREIGHNISTCHTRLEDVTSTSRTNKKKAKNCKKEKGVTRVKPNK
uniref:SWIM-type domain-containing protein n=1 Tax=Lactuca sativa TaxID=4236 RepID=A0A9R1UCL0_LACSA|nr:hypothetical protein LSAT_V11C900458570 [Lactuca sativa]